jgi:hypothetical protein
MLAWIRTPICHLSKTRPADQSTSQTCWNSQTSQTRGSPHYFFFLFFIGTLLGDRYKIWAWPYFQAGKMQPSDFDSRI